MYFTRSEESMGKKWMEAMSVGLGRMVKRNVGTMVEAGEKTEAELVLAEPFRVKSVEPIRATTREERARLLRQAHYNPFFLHSRDVRIDLLTDSGTGAMSARQWAVMLAADESHAGSVPFRRFQKAVRKIMPNLSYVHPVHQGRAAERILASLLGGKGKVIPTNSFFDTTRANFEYVGTTCLDLPIPEARDIDVVYPFKGNMNLSSLRELLETRGQDVPFVFITVTNNTMGGQPVSMDNIRKTAALAREFGKPFFLDSCRFAENAYFIKMREPEFKDHTIPDICREMYSYCNGTWVSGKKDCMTNIGGFLALDETMGDLSTAASDLILVSEGFPSQGGLAGRDLMAMAVGLEEVVSEHYLAYRVGSVALLGKELRKLDVPVIRPVGGHAVFVDAGRLLPHIPPLQFPGLSLANALYLQGGIRSCEIGSLMFGARPDGNEEAAGLELTRLAFPRRVYTTAHLGAIAEAFQALRPTFPALPGYRILHQPRSLRHFSAHLLPIALNTHNQDVTGSFI